MFFFLRILKNYNFKTDFKHNFKHHFERISNTFHSRRKLSILSLGLILRGAVFAIAMDNPIPEEARQEARLDVTTCHMTKLKHILASFKVRGARGLNIKLCGNQHLCFSWFYLTHGGAIVKKLEKVSP